MAFYNHNFIVLLLISISEYSYSVYIYIYRLADYVVYDSNIHTWPTKKEGLLLKKKKKEVLIVMLCFVFYDISARMPHPWNGFFTGQHQTERAHVLQRCPKRSHVSQATEWTWPPRFSWGTLVKGPERPWRAGELGHTERATDLAEKQSSLKKRKSTNILWTNNSKPDQWSLS